MLRRRAVLVLCPEGLLQSGRHTPPPCPWPPPRAPLSGHSLARPGQPADTPQLPCRQQMRSRRTFTRRELRAALLQGPGARWRPGSCRPWDPALLAARHSSPSQDSGPESFAGSSAWPDRLVRICCGPTRSKRLRKGLQGSTGRVPGRGHCPERRPAGNVTRGLRHRAARQPAGYITLRARPRRRGWRVPAGPAGSARSRAG